MLYLFNLYFKVTSIITLAGYITLSSNFTYGNDNKCRFTTIKILLEHLC